MLYSLLGLPIPKIEVFSPSASAVILAEKHSDTINYANVAEALKVVDTDIKTIAILKAGFLPIPRQFLRNI